MVSCYNILRVDVKGVYLILKKERYILTTGFCKKKEKYFRILSKEKTTEIIIFPKLAHFPSAQNRNYLQVLT